MARLATVLLQMSTYTDARNYLNGLINSKQQKRDIAYAIVRMLRDESFLNVEEKYTHVEMKAQTFEDGSNHNKMVFSMTPVWDQKAQAIDLRPQFEIVHDVGNDNTYIAFYVRQISKCSLQLALAMLLGKGNLNTPSATYTNSTV